MAGSTFAAMRMVCGHIHSAVITTSMLVTNSCCCTASARQKYAAYLEDQKKTDQRLLQVRKGKLCVMK